MVMHSNPPSTLWLFPTAVRSATVPGSTQLNLRLSAAIELASSGSQGMQNTNRGGWHSPKTVQNWTDPAVVELMGSIREQLSAWACESFDLEMSPEPALWQIELWANINRHGDFNVAHDHFRDGIVAAGIYYVACSGGNVGGLTVFINQQALPLHIDSPLVLKTPTHGITPKDGVMLIFPSWLGHEVTPYDGEGHRITMAFNAGHPALEVKRRPIKSALNRLQGWYQYWHQRLKRA